MVLAPLIVVALLGQEPDAVSALVRQLGAEDTATREEAERRLGEIGEPAEAALKEAVVSVDPEIRERAGHVLDRIVRLREEREFGERFRALATTFGERRCGSLVMKTRLARDGDQDVLIFEDHVGAWCDARCEFSLQPPRLRSFSWTMREAGEGVCVDGQVEGSELVLSSDGLDRWNNRHPLPERLFVTYEYYRLATLVRRAEGEVLRFTQFVVDPWENPLRASELRCVGRERVGDGDPWRVEYWRAQSDAREIARITTLWVTDDGELIQVQPENGKVLLVEK